MDEHETGRPMTEPWAGAHAGLPAPPAWPGETPASPPPTRGRAPRPVALLLAAAVVLAAAFGAWAGVTSFSNGSAPAKGGISVDAGSRPGVQSISNGVVNINTFARNYSSDRLYPLGAGSGMILTSDGEVLTNNHVVEGAIKIEVSIPGQSKTYTASVVGVAPSEDVALLQLDGASDLPTVTTGDTASLSIGDTVTVIGNALGKGGDPTISTGAISTLDRTITASDPGGDAERLDGMIGTDALVQPGDSGGALTNENGQVIGMITAGSPHPGQDGTKTIGYAIPIDHALQLVDQIRSGQASDTVLLGERGYLGVAVRSIDQATAAQLGGVEGAMVVGLQPGGPAEKAGMKTPAVITAIDGQSVRSVDDLGPLLHAHTPGESVSVTWVDSGGTHTATIELTNGPAV